MKSLLKILTSIMILATQFVQVDSYVYAKSSKERYNRITVGSIEVKDWQNDIVKRYPNLNHYHWNPIYANVQGWNKVKPPRHTVKGSNRPSVKKPSKLKSHKISPKYIKYRPLAKRPNHIYKKPQHISPIRTSKQSNSIGQTHLGYRHIKPQVRPSLSSVSPRLAYEDTNITLTRKPKSLVAPAKSFNTKAIPSLSSSSTSLRLNTRQVSGSLETKQVNAKLAQSNCMPEIKTYKPYKTKESGYYQVNNEFQTNSKVSGRLAF